MDEVWSLVAELCINICDLSEPRSDLENVEDEAAVCAALPFGDQEVRLAVTGDVASHRDQFRIGVVFVKGSDDESFAVLGSLLSVDGACAFQDYEIRVLRVGCRIEVGLRGVGSIAG